MARSVSIRPRAQRDIIDQAAYIANDNPGAAERFMEAVRKACELIADNPGIGMVYASPHSSIQGIGVWPIGGFGKHLIFYSVGKDVVEVVRVLHASRDIESVLDLDK